MADPAPNPESGSSGVEVGPGIVVPESTLNFSYSSSGGPGGQNVNRRATKAELRVSIDDIPLKSAQRERLAKNAGSRLTDSGEIIITSDEHRSQSGNRKECLARLRELIVKSLRPPKRRVATKPSKGSIRRRLDEKTQRGEIKKQRSKQGKPPGEGW